MTRQQKLDLIKEYLHHQIHDDGLWFEAEYASEAYLQSKLRELHKIIESNDENEIRLLMENYD